MPFKNKEDFNAYMREYMKNRRKNPKPSDTQIYDTPPILDDETIEEMKDGLSREEMDALGDAILEAQREPDPEALEEYSRLKASARDKIRKGESSLLFDIGGQECDPQTGEPIQKKSEDEKLGHWGRVVGSA